MNYTKKVNVKVSLISLPFCEFSCKTTFLFKFTTLILQADAFLHISGTSMSFSCLLLLLLTWIFCIIIGGPYGLFAGRDASRALATFSMGEDVFRNEYDDLSDLTSMQMESVREWEMQFTGTYLKYMKKQKQVSFLSTEKEPTIEKQVFF